LQENSENHQSDKWLISICAGWQQKQSLLNAKSLDIKIIAFDIDANAPCKSIVDIFFPIDIFDTSSIIEKIECLGIKTIGAVSFISDLGMKTAGILNDYFKTGGLTEELANKLTNKKLQRECWDSIGMFNPKWTSISNLSVKEINRAINQFPGKAVMIKPVDSAGSRGIIKIDNLSKNDIPLLKESSKFSSTGEVIIEEYIEGREFSIESFWNNGSCEILAISERIVLNNRSASLIISTDLPNDIERTIQDAAIASNTALGVRFGPTHTELILDSENKPFLLETAGRGGGFNVFDGLVPLVTGINYSKVFIEQLTRRKTSSYQVEKKNFAAIKYLPSRAGVIKSILGFEEANNIKGVMAECFVEKGDLTNASMADADRIGYIIVAGKTKSELHHLITKASNEIEIDYY
jgi:biotin carboxylase